MKEDARQDRDRAMPRAIDERCSNEPNRGERMDVKINSAPVKPDGMHFES